VASGKGVDIGRNRTVGRRLALPLGITPEEDGGIVADALGRDMHRHTTIQEEGGMGAPEMVEGETCEPNRLAR
jgi:hypothetical protein